MIGVVADDTTGANDIGVMFSNNQYSVTILPYKEKADYEVDSNVLIVDTDSRLDPQKLSYEKAYNATKSLKKLGCSLYFNKTCSVFRGNIGQEFDGMLDALNEEFAVISLSFPKNGRATVGGNHSVHGVLLENTNFANDPVHPMRESNLVDILQEQTSRKVTLINIDVVRKGTEFLKKTLEKAKETANYCIIDSENQKDLEIVAEAIHDFPVICGSSAIAEELPKHWPATKGNSVLENLDIKDNNGVMVVSGSMTSETKKQTSYLITNGMQVAVFDTRKVFNQVEAQNEITRIVDRAKDSIINGEDLLVMANNNDDVVAQTKELGSEEYNLDSFTISKLVSAKLAEASYEIVKVTGLKRLVIAGGDTSGTILRKLGIEGNYVLKEIEPGIPSGLSIGKEMLIVLKSGSFGKVDFLAKAIDHLKDLTQGK
ncbi:four-carbon acid sugar kinase family protein [Salibacterium salarium]|uniref:Four-carbon acid sugar kinase family protein n=1 Tax=Salibacterium salarium TaxID=284579 RepID=A0A3R9QL07_9BACI|nr:four-carbon acid sugar kinase family protein [Salibacterium salarium]RSL33131.1 four-carbon acid sugar kinase family protein [Salibacterium salarium]